MSKSVISIEEIISSSISHLIEEFREISGESGWHQYLGNDKIGNVANSQALILFHKCNITFDKKQKVIDTIISNQFSSNEDLSLEGGWSYKSNFNEAPTTECTAWVLLGLHDELEMNSESITKGLLWLRNNHLNNSKDLGWGSIKSDVSRVYSTCLSLQVLSKYDEKDSDEFNRGLNWLKKAKNEDGGWGETEGSSSKLTHTSHAILTLLECGTPVESTMIQNALNWILELTHETDSWNDLTNIGWREHLEFQGKRITFYHYSLAWIIRVLQITNHTSSKQYQFLLNELLNEEQDGNWIHPYLKSEPQKTIWSKHDALIVLKYHQENISDKVSITSRPKKKYKKGINWGFLLSNWFVISLITAILALILTKVVTYFPSLIDEVLIVTGVFIFVYLRNPVKRYFRIAQSLIALLISLLILPSYKLEFEKTLTDSSGIEHYFLQLLTVDIHFLVYVVIGGLIALNFILDYKTRKKE